MLRQDVVVPGLFLVWFHPPFAKSFPKTIHEVSYPAFEPTHMQQLLIYFV